MLHTAAQARQALERARAGIELDAAVRDDLNTLSDFLAALGPRLGALDLNALRLPSAMAELAASRRETEAAVDAIMTAAEAILADAPDRETRDHANAIMAACAFQDITGQRGSKVIALLSGIERRLAWLAGLAPPEVKDPAEETAQERRNRELILNGPALDGPEVSQADIDALFD